MLEDQSPSHNLNEQEESSRVAALEHYRILDSSSEGSFDSIVDLVARVIDAPVSHLSFVDRDRQWFKANLGSDIREKPRHQSICDHCMQAGSMLEVEDLSVHPLLKEHSVVQQAPFARSYLGVPILAPDGRALGVLCVMDTKVRSFEEKDRLLLREQAQHVVTLLEARLQMKFREDHEQGFSQRVMEAEEELQKKIGQELHEGLGENLNFLKSFLGQLKEVVEPRDQEAYETCMESIEGSLERSVKKVHGLSYDLTLKGLEEKSLEEALIGLLFPLDRGPRNLEIELEPGLKDDPSPFIKRNLYRIVQELVGNTLKHSEASKAKVRLVQDQGWLHLHFWDDGKGLEAGGGVDGKGLDSIRGRIHALKGEFNLEASPEVGLTYAIRLPFQ